ncbi:MAG TPA: hypothetical protein VFG61_05450 [Gaiellaceae bacterium]|jgi:hypothetical protein|nr:hypothetical protein [Gaiellaceae bacterium]
MKNLALILLVALALPGAAFAKGPSKASIAGPGIATIKISGAEGSATPFWRLVEVSGWFEGAFGPRRLPQTPPSGELGPRYTITWTVPSSSRIEQDVYPYAEPLPVAYMPAGQKIWDSPVKGGWFVAKANLKKSLVRLGLPAEPPPPPAPSGSEVQTGGIAAAAAAFFALATSLQLRSSSAAGI